jgi:hypothetical protein
MTFYDKAARLIIDGQDLLNSVFKLTPSSKVAYRVSSDIDDPIASFTKLPYGADSIDVTYPDTITEIYVYKKAAVTVATVTVVYTTASKALVLSVAVVE